MKRSSWLAPLAGVTFLTAPVDATAAPAASQGETLYRQRCAACHVITADRAPTIGPNLYGVVLRKAASTPYVKYSDALKKSKLTWSRANLDRYLAAPAKAVPGTKMPVALPDAAQRSAIIDYLARAK